MTETEQLRKDLTDLRESIQTILALTITALGQAGDAKLLLASITLNLEAKAREKPTTATLDAMSAALLLPLSSTALKQRPNDPQVLQWYRDLRSGERH